MQEQAQDTDTFETRKNGHHCHVSKGHMAHGYNLQDGRYYLSPSRAADYREALAKSDSAAWLLNTAQKAALPQQEAASRMFRQWWTHALADIDCPTALQNGWRTETDSDGRLFIFRTENDSPKPEKTATCLGCGSTLATFPVDEYTAHVEKCEQHPLGVRIRELKAALAKASATE